MTDRQQPLDDLDALLAAPQADHSAIRNLLRDRSTAALASRARRRKVIRLACMAACYLLGMVTIYAWQQVLASTPNETQAQHPPSPSSPKTAPVEQIVKRPDAPPAPAPRPAKSSRFDSLRELGDHHLIADRNPEQALRCYRVALRYATEQEFTAASREGTWLLRAICLDSK